MSSLRRKPNNKRGSVRAFNRNASKSHAYNLRIARGGWRL